MPGKPLLLIGVLVLGMTLASAAALATPMTDLQRAVREAENRAEALTQTRDRLHQATISALNRRDMAAFAAAEKREAETAIGTLQSTAAVRRARQALAEAVNDAVEQGQALERAAGRAATGEVAPSVHDHLACDGPDCAPVTAREHAALILMGAVGPAFDATQWPPDKEPSPITVLAYTPDALPLVILRRAAAEAARRAQTTTAAADAARGRLQASATDPAAVTAYVKARTEADTAQAERLSAETRLQHVLDGFADAGRALKHAGLLAGEGYALKADGRKICNPSGCRAAEGLGAAAFLVIGAAENMNGGLKRFSSFVTTSPDGHFVFR